MANQAKQAAERRLREMGAVRERREDRHGETKSGWWLDGIYLGPTNDPEASLRVALGGG